jgi:signal transduction histidine kinase
MVPRSGWLLLAITAFGAIVVGATGVLLLVSYRTAALEAAASREAILVRARAHVVRDELDALVHEVARLSHLADIDLADGNLEPEKNVLRIARRDSAVFSVAIAILDEHGTVLWAEPRDARPVAPGPALVGLARGSSGPALVAHPGEIALAAPVAGRGAIAALVNGSRAQALFGPDLAGAIQAGGSVSMISPGGGGDADVTLAVIRADPEPSEPVSAGGESQAWVKDRAGRRWLVSEAKVGEGPLLLRLVQAERSVEGGLSTPFHRLVVAVAAAVVLAVAVGAILGRLLRKLDRSELELARARDLAAMGKTAAAIAHEVKNGVNGLSVALDVLAEGKGDPAVRRELHAQARAEVVRLRDVTDDLTIFAAPPRLTPTEVDVAEVCQHAVTAVADAADDAGVEVVLVLPPGPVPVRVDLAKLVGAVANLARNGVEAMGPGAFGEPLGAARPVRERRVEVSARAEDSVAVVEIADRGGGIPPELRAHLFEPFVTTKRTGTGLGLAIARRVVEAHGGRIEAIDREGGGTVFRVTLPRRVR